MGFTRITDDDTQNRGVIGLPDTPNYSTAEMQEKLDELALAVIIPKINNLISELEGMSAALSLGITVPAGLTAESNLQSVIDTIYGLLAGVGAAEHSHDNKTVLDTITDALIKGLEDIASSLAGITGVTNSVNGSATELVTAKAVADYVQVLGGGDMTRAIYDSNLNGIVDDAEKLGGELPSYYQSATDNRLTTVAKTIVDAINELANKEVSVLDTAEEIKANTTNGKAAGANGVKQLFEEVNNSLSDKVVILNDTITATGQTFTLNQNASKFKKLKIECSSGGALNQSMYIDCDDLPCVVDGGNQGYFGLSYFIDATWRYYFSFDVTETSIIIRDYNSPWGSISLKVTGYHVL